MQNKKILIAIAAAVLLTTGVAYAENTNTEYCTVTDKNGNNIVKAGKADCNSLIKLNCKAGENVAGDSSASILVPKGQCDNIKAGNFSELSPAMASIIKTKLEMKMMEVTTKTSTTTHKNAH